MEAFLNRKHNSRRGNVEAQLDFFKPNFLKNISVAIEFESNRGQIKMHSLFEIIFAVNVWNFNYFSGYFRAFKWHGSSIAFVSMYLSHHIRECIFIYHWGNFDRNFAKITYRAEVF